MFRFLQFGKQAFKVVLRPTSVKFHTIPLAYTSSQTHGTITRYFSSSSKVGAWEYYVNRHRLEVKNRFRHLGHDIIIDSEDFDVSVSGIDHKVLETTIAKKLGIPYLSKATKSQAEEVVLVANGYIHPEGLKPIIPLVVSHAGEARWVFFLIDTAASVTYLSDQVSASVACLKLLVEVTKSIMLTSVGLRAFWYNQRLPRFGIHSWTSPSYSSVSGRISLHRYQCPWR